MCLKLGRKLEKNAKYTAEWILRDMSKDPGSVIALMYRDYATYEKYLHKPKDVKLTLSYDDDNVIDDFYAPFARAQKKTGNDILTRSVTTDWTDALGPILWNSIQKCYAAHQRNEFRDQIIDVPVMCQFDALNCQEPICSACKKDMIQKYGEDGRWRLVAVYNITAELKRANQRFNYRNEIILLCPGCYYQRKMRDIIEQYIEDARYSKTPTISPKERLYVENFHEHLGRDYN